MKLKSRLLLPSLLCGLALLVCGAIAASRYATSAHSAIWIWVAAATAMLVAFALAQSIAIDIFVERPLENLTKLSGAPATLPDCIDNVSTTVNELRQTIDELNLKCESFAVDRRQLEIALQASEERYALVMRISDDGPWEWNLRTQEFIPSPRWKSMLGYTDDEFPNSLQVWREHVHPLDLKSVESALSMHVEGLTPGFEHQFRLLHKDGHYRWVSSVGRVIRHASGNAMRIVALDTDVTRIKHIETVLQHVVEGIREKTGDAFFRALVRHFAAALDVPCAFITECIGHPTESVRTLAYWLRNDFKENIEFRLAGTPCEQVVDEGKPVFYPSGVGKIFPREKGYECYYGVPIHGSSGELLGHMAFFDDRARKEEDILMGAVYQVFTTRAAAEIERKLALDDLTRDSSMNPIQAD